MYKTRQLRSTFWSSDVEKMHAAVAKHAFASENVKKTAGPGALFEVQMSQKCTPLWRNVHFEAKMYKTRQLRTTFQTSDAPKIGRRCGEKQFLKSKCTKHVSSGQFFWSSDVQKLVR